MKHYKFMGRIALLFLIVIMMSFIPDNFHEFFGDWHCEGGDQLSHQGCEYGPDLIHNATWHWGFRHWMWMFMGVSLFMYNLIWIISDISASKN